MKRTSKLLAAILSLCILVGVLTAVIASAATAVQELGAGTATGGYLDFDNYTNDSLHSNGGTQSVNYIGSKAYIYSTRMASAGTVKINNESVDGRTNKYLNIVLFSNSSKRRITR